MFTIYLNDYILHDEYNENKILYDVNLNMELNSAGSLTFKMYPEHELYDDITILNSTISVYNGPHIGMYTNSKKIFEGRVISIDIDFYNGKTITCEGSLAYLNDSIIGPFTFPVNKNEKKFSDYIKMILSKHNLFVEQNRQIRFGSTEIDIDDFGVFEETGYISAMQAISSISSSTDGFFLIRYEQNEIYLDFKVTPEDITDKLVELGVNLNNITSSITGDGVYNVLIPLGREVDSGKKDSDGNAIMKILDLDYADPLTGIKYIPDGRVNDKITKYGNKLYLDSNTNTSGYKDIVGNIATTMNFDTDNPLYLLSQAVKQLGEISKIKRTISISATEIDLDNNFPFKIGTYVKTYSKSHDGHISEDKYLLKTINIPIYRPDPINIEVGNNQEDISGTTSKSTSLSEVNDNRLKSLNSSISITKQDLVDKQNRLIPGNGIIINNDIISVDSDGLFINGLNIYSDTKENWDSNPEMYAIENSIYVYTNYNVNSDGKFIPAIKMGVAGELLSSIPFVAGNDYYRPGDVINIDSSYVASGLISTSNTVVIFSIPLPKKLDNVSSITINSLKTGVRLVGGGYLESVTDQTQWVGMSGMTLTTKINRATNSVRIIITKSSAFTNSVNNTPVSLHIYELKMTIK